MRHGLIFQTLEALLTWFEGTGTRLVRRLQEKRHDTTRTLNGGRELVKAVQAVKGVEGNFSLVLRILGQSAPAPTNAPVGHSVHGMGCIFCPASISQLSFFF